MLDTTTSQPENDRSPEYEAIADQLLADMRQLELLIQADRTDIDRLKAETKTLREESVQIEAETRAALARLKAVLA